MCVRACVRARVRVNQSTNNKSDSPFVKKLNSIALDNQAERELGKKTFRESNREGI